MRSIADLDDMVSYNQTVLDHFNHPRNTGELDDADVQVTVGNPDCEDYIQVWMQIKEDRIERFTYKVFGCVAAIATTSAVSELVTGLSIEQAQALNDDDVVRYLNGLPVGKEHCSLLGIRAIQQGILEYNIQNAYHAYENKMQRLKSCGMDIQTVCQVIVKRLKLANLTGEIAILAEGHEFLALSVAQSGFPCVAIDKSAERLFSIDHLAAYYNVQDRLLTERENIVDSGIEDHTFSAVISCGTLHLLEQSEKALSEMCRICKKDGLLIVADYNQRGFDRLIQFNSNENKNAAVPEMAKVHDWMRNHCKQCHFTSLECLDLVEGIVQ